MYCKSAFLTIGEGTPYKALCGRVPLLLRDFDRSGAQEYDDSDRGGAFRHYQRLREIATTSIIEATAQARVDRASKARKAPAMEVLKLEIGDLVDFYRPAKTPKDVPDWKGPAKVVSAESPETGTLTIQWQGHDTPVQAACQNLTRP